ncbi:UvrD-helicase domain-containing protein [Nocardiopsis alborubida]|uniref:DNA 3'-5' helicase n=1 Tax=Nocardiopsis alborubida TaxID=146802 RepID=A0A7X6MGD5_9ACTN|nr:UvrD-helicase domain-containing protein [Nocardiopsis alborubida]NKZ00010.1 ATP-dependent helicase [Nocardiopsis alborubida]
MRTDLQLPDEGSELREHARVAQRAVVEAETLPGRPVSAVACPGAGKTRVIVDRHLERALPARKGRAIASFTKVAGRELRRRCREAGKPELAAFPHFIGTIDTFIWLHLVRPYLRVPAQGGRSWRRLESWRDHPGASDRGLNLEDFTFAATNNGMRVGAAMLMESSRYKLGGRSPYNPQLWAAQKIGELFEEGYVTGDLVRDLALLLLADPERSEVMMSVLTARFSELVVDEAQDCSAEDRRILQELAARGLPLMLVGDPDQAIYGFRNTESASDAPVLLDVAQPLRLRHNWRSNQTICDLAATLRTSERQPDIATGPHRDERVPILLTALPSSGTGHVRAFCDEADQIGIPQEERLVIAHRRSSLPKDLTGAAKPPTSHIGRLAWAVGVLNAGAPPTKQREEAGAVIRASILDVWCGKDDLPEAARLERHKVTAQGLARSQALVLRDLPPLDQMMGEWREQAKEVFRRHSPSQDLVVPKSNPRWARRQANTDDKPAFRVGGHSRPQADTPVQVGRVTSIHQVKGEEADAVLVVIPKPTPDNRCEELISSWLDRERPATQELLEDRNVLYVAATRARRLLAFALCVDHLPRVEAFLEQRGVPFRVVN